MRSSLYFYATLTILHELEPKVEVIVLGELKVAEPATNQQRYARVRDTAVGGAANF